MSTKRVWWRVERDLIVEDVTRWKSGRRFYHVDAVRGLNFVPRLAKLVGRRMQHFGIDM